MSNARLLTILFLIVIALAGHCAWMVHLQGPFGPLFGLYVVPILFVLSLIAGIACGLRRR